MDILDSVKKMANELTGQAQREREQVAAQKREQASQEKATMESLEKIAAAGAPERAAAERERAAAEKSRAERHQGGPGDRFAAQVTPGQQDRMREARERKPEPEKLPETPAKVAEQLKYQPTGLQRGPSPGGGNYVNPLAYKAVQQSQQNLQDARVAGPAQQASPTMPQREPTMVEKAVARQKEQAQQQPPPAPQQTQAVAINQGITR